MLRLCGEQGALIRAILHRDKALKLPLPASPGRPYSAEEKARMLEEAAKLRTPQMHAAHVRMEAKRRALDEIATRQGAAD